MRILSVIVIVMMIFPCVAKGDTGLLWLVNRENALCADFVPSNLVVYRGAELRAEARDAFVEMVEELEAAGIFGLKLQSAYRSYEHQSAIFERKKQFLIAQGHDESEAEENAATVVQPPGASEHQLGLALDVTMDGQLSQEFAQTKAGIWLEENCHRFGFIVRYPQYKTDVTDIIYEPWHLRYVGRPHAQIMKETGLALEEYHLYLAQIPMYLVWESDGYFLVSYTHFPPEFPNEQTTISAVQHGENAAFIIAVRKSNCAVHHD
ncbi:MAG: M15 family metallopeptidase [Defluviitaleaceae bacterium]|nr:M15 family metallopeptidase [Defluviitaleaceae bacterium]MCL2262911.1 M15 family metallopeptidase [Defluviitaleaceae bacterium]